MTGTPSQGDWPEVMAAFDAWADLASDARGPWLERLATSNAGLHARVVSLIRADEDAQAQSFLSPQARPRAAPTAGLEGRHLGPWLVERLIGSGGMGHVWLARRTDGLYDGQAAIKLMRLASGDAGADARFAREGRLLGRLGHPNIARLLDAGVTAEGERFLVLEYIEGERIDRWCDEHRLTVQRRLELFIDVCKAVAHAHENLVRPSRPQAVEHLRHRERRRQAARLRRRQAHRRREQRIDGDHARGRRGPDAAIRGARATERRRRLDSDRRVRARRRSLRLAQRLEAV
jgi:serine/threonine-protein kinase